MNIGSLAKQASVNVQTVRYYEKIGILSPALRRDSGYRVYDEGSLKRLLFIKRAQDLGFSLDEIKELLSLRNLGKGSREKVRNRAKEKLEEVRLKIVELKRLESILKKLVSDCEHGAATGPCPILERMEMGK